MRGILHMAGYSLDDGVWTKEGYDSYLDARIEEDHFRVLIESMWSELTHSRAATFLRKVQGGVSR
ncbi:MAG: hypothetical protein ACYTFQ_19100 [Planctomycetota bacterium]|jgi:hypothetical protein